MRDQKFMYGAVIVTAFIFILIVIGYIYFFSGYSANGGPMQEQNQPAPTNGSVPNTPGNSYPPTSQQPNTTTQ